ncbi:FAD-NAD(P)-binding [Halorientalis persicus]|uniref:FAD-NAD(P)-binding n=2 Tax=Halorientalis persicus TaxID=1367881 RepID=A0A1H8QAC8_9EURY|nr:FAD-NAD(P)-binding [Halorientalis persicus]
MEGPMTNDGETHRDTAVVIVGCGIHGTTLAVRLLAETDLTTDDIRIVDEHGEPLAAFEAKARRCGMETLRSTFVQHVSPEPFSLESFAEGRDREHELVPTRNYPPRPTLSLFLDHAQFVVDQHNLTESVVEARMTNVTRRDDGVTVETTGGSFDAGSLVLAIGMGGEYTWPTWADPISDNERIQHVWNESFSPTETTASGESLVVGGGITAGQVVATLAERGGSVTLCHRTPIETAESEANPCWINWRHVERELHCYPPGSERRYRTVQQARNDGTIPPYLFDEIKDLERHTHLDCRHGTIETVAPVTDGLLVRFGDGTSRTVARILLATGFESPFDSPMAARIASWLDLERGYCNVPVLNDETLAWQRREGEGSQVYVTGALAEGTVGPLARNVVGAKRAGERIATTFDGGKGDEYGRSTPGRSLADD